MGSTEREERLGEGRTIAGVPEQIGRYRIVRPLSKGGMALVFEGRRETQVGVSRRVAIKVILPDYAESTTFRDLFVNEARIGAAMHHQNLVQILDFDSEDNRYFLVMEYVDGLTISRMIALSARHDVRIPLSVICEVGRQACDGLHFAHEAVDTEGRPLGMIHRDIKPSNLILSPEGAVKILDFGISKGRLRTERQGSVKGTWGYMAPEQAVGTSLRPNADVFSLGIVLYELAARRAMFHRLPQDEVRQMLLDDHPARIVTTLDAPYAPLVGVLDKALKRDPLERFATAKEFGRHLAELLPDPHTTRSEVAEFYRQVHELNEADRHRRSQAPPSPKAGDKVRPAGDSAPPRASRDSEAEPEGPQAMMAAALVGMVVVVLAFLAGIGLVRVVVAPTSSGTAPPPASPAIVAPSDGGGLEGAAVVDAPQRATLVVGSRQPASVYVDGEKVRDPAAGVQVEPGRHVVSIVADDGRRTSWEVELAPGDAVHKTWDFERLDWR